MTTTRSMANRKTNADTAVQVSDDSTPSTSNVCTPQRKGKKRLQKYREEWEKENTWLKKVRDNTYKAHCTVCRRTFSIGHGGLTDLKQHASSGGHMKNMRDVKARGTLDQFVVHQTTAEADMSSWSGDSEMARSTEQRGMSDSRIEGMEEEHDNGSWTLVPKKRRRLSESQMERMRVEEDNRWTNSGMEQNQTNLPQSQIQVNKLNQLISDANAEYERVKALVEKLETQSKAGEPDGPESFNKITEQILNHTQTVLATLTIVERECRQQLAYIGSKADTSLDHLEDWFLTAGKVLLGVHEQLLKLQDQNSKYGITDIVSLLSLKKCQKISWALLTTLVMRNPDMEQNGTNVPEPSTQVDKLNQQISEIKAGFETLKTLNQSLDMVLETQSRVEEPNGPQESIYIKLILQVFKLLKQARRVVVTPTKVELVEWKRRQQLACIESKADTSLDHLEDWFSTAGKVLLGVHEQLLKLQDQNSKCSSTDAFYLPASMKVMDEKFACALLRGLLTNALVIEKQPVMRNYSHRPLVLKLGVQFTMTVRFLVNIPECKDNLNVKPVFDKDVKETKTVKGFRLFDFKRADSKVLDVYNNRGLMAEFVNMKLENKSGTPRSSENTLRVTEELHIIKFVTDFHYAGLKYNIEASSLPVVVISCTIQVPNAWASIMWWNMVSTSEPWDLSLFQNPPPLTWEQLSQVLSWQFSTIGQRGLDENQLSMLRDKIVVDSNDVVEWKCFSMSKSVWTWIDEILHLIKDHMVDLWRDGYIMGFVKEGKEGIRELLETVQAGNFLLHFCESNDDGVITFSWVDYNSSGEPLVFTAKPLTKKVLSVFPLRDSIHKYSLESHTFGLLERRTPLIYFYPDIPIEHVFGRYNSPEMPLDDGYLPRVLSLTSNDPLVSEPDLDDAVDEAIASFS
ncbi:signal transducer and activator of transcription 1-alpha/beta-like isoform X2 [Pelmatolapia mariae]|uniref:signal transducer and activator of transcription 1-alpha/beta-like isoform X2 n=1 Tax=Pelmatolapia mariae TaxID=158779 RepID=UPI002FE5F8D1